VTPVTVSIGAIDAADVIAEQCTFEVACVRKSGLRSNLAAGLDRILEALRAAAPDAQIILAVFYNPFTISNPGTDGLWRHNYIAIEKAVARHNGVRVADVSRIIGSHNACELTFLCASGDSHPTDAGYRRIGDLMFHGARFDHSAPCHPDDGRCEEVDHHSRDE
jgi:lysophospholipase L1-like esterase